MLRARLMDSDGSETPPQAWPVASRPGTPPRAPMKKRSTLRRTGQPAPLTPRTTRPTGGSDNRDMVWDSSVENRTPPLSPRTTPVTTPITSPNRRLDFNNHTSDMPHIMSPPPSGRIARDRIPWERVYRAMGPRPPPVFLPSEDPAVGATETMAEASFQRGTGRSPAPLSEAEPSTAMQTEDVFGSSPLLAGSQPLSRGRPSLRVSSSSGSPMDRTLLQLDSEGGVSGRQPRWSSRCCSQSLLQRCIPEADEDGGMTPMVMETQPRSPWTSTTQLNADSPTCARLPASTSHSTPPPDLSRAWKQRRPPTTPHNAESISPARLSFTADVAAKPQFGLLSSPQLTPVAKRPKLAHQRANASAQPVAAAAAPSSVPVKKSGGRSSKERSRTLRRLMSPELRTMEGRSRPAAMSDSSRAKRGGLLM